MAMQDVKLPEVGEGVTEGEMVKWLVQVGDSVEVDQPIAEIMTDKATVEVPSPISGIVKELKVAEGDIVPIESTLLVLDVSAASSTAGAMKPAAATPAAPQPAAAAAPVAAAPTVGAGGGMDIHPPVAESHVLATPGTRRLARELTVDINHLQGTGLAGRVTRDDVLKSASTQGTGATAASRPSVQMPASRAYVGPAGAVEERVPLRGIRRKIAEQMQMTKHVVPHFTIMDEANVTELVRVRNQAKEVGDKMGVKVTYLPFIMKALVATLREFPMFNGSIDDASQEIVYKKYFNVGFAADTPNGLLVPVVKDVDRKTILELSQEIDDLATRARAGKLSMDEMKGATITITNIGSVGGTYATPIINHPEVAILGVYKMTDKPVLKDGKFRAAKVMNYTATCDHRLIDGAVAANFLKSFMGRIENPSRLLLEMI